jgi:hypothetical protein
VVYTVTIPALENVHLAIVGPLEGILGQHPIRWPYAFADRRQDGCREIPSWSCQRLVRCQTRRSVTSILNECSKYEAVIAVEQIGGVVRVHLLFIVAPTMIADFMTEVEEDRRGVVKGGLPVHLIAV